MADAAPLDGEGPVVAAFFGTQALGNFIIYHVVAASVACAMGGRLLAIYREDRPYKTIVTLMNPWVTQTVKTPTDPNAVVPLDWFDGRAGIPGRPFASDWYDRGFHAPAIVLPPSMMDMGRMVGPAPALRIPDALAPALEEALVRLGVDRQRWFAVLHMRESGYGPRAGLDTVRSVDPRTYVPAIEEIIAAGGQVVRLGDASMMPLPEMEGLIDLARAPTGFAEQAFATSQSRFFLGTDSGPTQLACALKVPAATTNTAGIGVWNDGDVVLFKRFRLSNGRVLGIDELLAAGNWGMQVVYPKHEATVEDNTPEELAAVVRHMIATTVGVDDWRKAASDAPTEPAEALTFPLPWRPATEIADLTLWPQADG